MKTNASSIEPLETRIALASAINPTTAVFTDVDGDLVTIKFSKPIAQQVLYSTTFGAPSITGAEQLLRIDLINVTKAAAAGVSITFTAVPKDVTGDGIKDGDGKVNVGEILASGQDLGAVALPGDLGRIVAGSIGSAGPVPIALASLSVRSLGEYGLSTGAADLHSSLSGSVGKLFVKGNVRNAWFEVANPFGGSLVSLGSLTIGGSLIGGGDMLSGAISVGGTLTAAKIVGDVVGGGGASTGNVFAAKLTSLTVGGSLFGGGGNDSGSVVATTLGTVSIGKNVLGGEGGGLIRSLGAIGSVAIGGSLVGDRDGSGLVRAVGDIGAVKIGGDVRGGSRVGAAETGSGLIDAGGKINSVSVRGSLVGGATDDGGAIRSGGALGAVSIGGSLVGGDGDISGSIRLGESVGSVRVGGSLVGGGGELSGALYLVLGSAGSVVIEHDLTGGSGARSGAIEGFSLGKVKIGGDVVGGSGRESGLVFGGNIDALSIGGSLRGTSNSGIVESAGAIGTLTIGGDVVGVGNKSGYISGGLGIKTLTIGGSLIGGSSFESGVIKTGGTLWNAKIMGDIRGGSSASSVTDSGSILAQRITSLTVSGSIFSGRAGSGYNPAFRSPGSITAAETIGSLTVQGSIVGNDTIPVFITAGGDPTISVTRPDIAIGAITVGGNADRAFILAGSTYFGASGTGSNVSADASIGAVRVGGDWIGSFVSAGVGTGADLIFGTADDRLLAGSVRDNLSVSKIASIVIGGQIKSERNAAYPFGGNQTYGFVAQQIGSFSHDGIVVPLTAGASNDTFALGKARPLGASRSTLNTDGFAVHVFEV